MGFIAGLVAVFLGAAPCAPDTPEPKKHYSLKSQVPPILLAADVEQKVAALADCFFAKTGRSLLVTDGFRTAAEQAKIMFDILRGDKDLVKDGLYPKVQSDEIKRKYDNAADKTQAEEIQAAMAQVIQQQMDTGVYISNHLRSGAVDLRVVDKSDKPAFDACVASVEGVRQLPPHGPPHIHLDIASGTVSNVRVSLASCQSTGKGTGRVWSGCRGTISMNITKIIQSGYVGVFLPYTFDDSYYGEVQVTSGAAPGNVTISVQNIALLGYCDSASSLPVNVDVYDGRMTSAGPALFAPQLGSVAVPPIGCSVFR